MGTQIKNTLTFVDLVPGTSVVIPHGLNNGTIAVVPDIVFVPAPGLDILVDVTNVTVFNAGAEVISGSLLVEWWHTIERAFGDAASLNLPVKPYVVVASEGGNAPPIPEFDFRTVTIYARLTGNDTTGDGTLLNPFRTTQRAVRAVSFISPPGVRFVIDNSGVGVETLPDDYQLPCWKSSSPTFFDGADAFSGVRAGITFYAEPILADLAVPTRATIELADILAITNDPTSTLTRVQLTVAAAAAKAWGVDEWKGKLFSGAGGSFESAVVDSNTADTLMLTTDVSPTAPLRIMDNSAILEGQSSTFGIDSGALVANAVDSIAFIGQNIRPTNPFSGGLVGFGCGGYGGPYCGFCTLENVFVDDAIRQVIFSQCSINGGLSNAQLIFFGSFVQNWFVFERATNRQLVISFSVYEGGSTIEVFYSIGVPGLFIPGSLVIRNSEIRDNLGDAIHWTGGSALLDNVLIHDNGGSAIVFDQGVAYGRLNGVTGTANAVFGCNVQNASQVEVDAVTNDPVTGLLGVTADQKVGDLAGAAWPNAAFSRYDLTAVGAGGATGTGSRLYQL